MSYKHYHITLTGDTNSYVFTYELAIHRPAQEWARQITHINVGSLRKSFDPWIGLHILPEEKIDRLNQLIDLINEWIPDKIIDKWDNSDPQASLNKLHIHFPEQEKNETDVNRLNQLAEYNDVIHDLEFIIRKRNYKDSLRLLLLPESGDKTEIIYDDYQYFKPSRVFGELCLHYPHVGRHPLELLKARDIKCPVDQIVTQTMITPYHSLIFSKDPYTDAQYNSAFDKFYRISKINQLFDRSDPKLAFGYIPIGNLIYVDGNTIHQNSITDIVKSTYKITNWEIE